MSTDSLSEPWRSFLLDLDHELEGPTELHCFGGFVVAEYYGLTRPTADLDIIEATGATDLKTLAVIAGKGSALAKKHHVYLDIVTVATVPEDFSLSSSSASPTPSNAQTVSDRVFAHCQLVVMRTVMPSGGHIYVLQPREEPEVSVVA